jgi:chromosome segregation ATPase
MAEIAENRLVNEKAIETIAHYASRLDVIQSDISEIKNDIVIITTKIDN